MASGDYGQSAHASRLAKNRRGIDLCPCAIMSRASIPSQKRPGLHDIWSYFLKGMSKS